MVLGLHEGAAPPAAITGECDRSAYGESRIRKTNPVLRGSATVELREPGPQTGCRCAPISLCPAGQRLDRARISQSAGRDAWAEELPGGMTDGPPARPDGGEGKQRVLATPSTANVSRGTNRGKRKIHGRLANALAAASSALTRLVAAPP